ncbi:MAG: hypothetical protein EXS37_21075 [Opitutus sp.]|nr:hypothetical protein [Opitutus sp.]
MRPVFVALISLACATTQAREFSPDFAIVLIDGNVDPDTIANRVVVSGWDAARAPALPIPHGPKEIHRLFVWCLAAACRGGTVAAPTAPP